MDVSLELDAESVNVPKRRVVRKCRKILEKAAKANQIFRALHTGSVTRECKKRRRGM
jgi:hypothetical protein